MLQYTNTAIEGSLEVKLPTVWTVGKAEVGRVREEKKRSEKIREERRCRFCEKVGKSRFTVFFRRFVAQEGRKVGSLKFKAASAEPAGQMRDEKLHAVMARSTIRSQNVQSTPASPHFWKVPCRKSVKNLTGSDHFWK